jgi:hypothetical protein
LIGNSYCCLIGNSYRLDDMTESHIVIGARTMAEPAEEPYRFENGTEFRARRSMVQALRWIDKVGSLHGWSTDDGQAAAMFVKLVGLIGFAKGHWFLTDAGRAALAAESAERAASS